MGITERRERERQEMRELILTAAMQLFTEESFEATTMRRIADKIEYTPGTIYGYFKDKNEILFALHERGFDELVDAQRKALEGVVDPDDRLTAIARAYMGFALDNPGQYDLMFIDRATGETIAAEQRWDSGLCGYKILRDVVVEVLAKHRLDLHPDVGAFACWSFVHGMVSLRIRNRCVMYPAEQLPQIMHLSNEFFLLLLKGQAHQHYALPVA